MTTYYGSPGVARLAADLRRVPTELRSTIRSALNTSGSELRDLAAANAAQWSTTIPNALKVRTRFGGTRPGVYVVASRLAAPAARPYEGITGNDQFRAPLFGDLAHWYPHDTRPYLAPAVEAESDQAINRMQAALDASLLAAGFK